MEGLALKSGVAATELSLGLKPEADDIQRQNPASISHQSHRFHSLWRDLCSSFTQRYNSVFLGILTLESDSSQAREDWVFLAPSKLREPELGSSNLFYKC